MLWFAQMRCELYCMLGMFILHIGMRLIMVSCIKNFQLKYYIRVKKLLTALAVSIFFLQKENLISPAKEHQRGMCLHKRRTQCMYLHR